MGMGQLYIDMYIHVESNGTTRKLLRNHRIPERHYNVTLEHGGPLPGNFSTEQI